MDNQNAIEVRNMSKSFKVEYDKANTFGSERNLNIMKY